MRRTPLVRLLPLFLLVAGSALVSSQACAASTPEVSAILPVSATTPLSVQINQVALDSHGPKIALVEARSATTQGSYRVLRNAQQVGSGPLQALPAFSDWGAGLHYFAVDFSRYTEVGDYQIEVELDGQLATTPAVPVSDNALFTRTATQLLDYFRKSRNTSAADHRIRIFGTQRFVDVWGGWNDAGGDNGKYLSHLSYAHFFNPQQASLATWVLASTADQAPELYRQAGLETAVREEAFWGADYLHRILDRRGYFYLTVFDKWGTDNAERVVTGFEGIDGVYTKNYKSSFRAGGGMAIAALARAALLARHTGQHGQYKAATYLADAERAFAHLQQHNRDYCSDGKENIIDDYTALMAAVELHHATRQPRYLAAARLRAASLSARLKPGGYFTSDQADRPFYHGVEAGLPIISLAYYQAIETDAGLRAQARLTIATALEQQLALDREVANPYNYARQIFRTFEQGKLSGELQRGFFMPHANETGYWWQGESARLSSLSTAALLGGRISHADAAGPYGVRQDLAEFAQNQVDWTLGRNPYGMTMLYGYGQRNPPHAESAGTMLVGGISNGITGAQDSPTGAGIEFSPGPDENQWRWVEQWLPHSAWMLLNATAMAPASKPSHKPPHAALPSPSR
ncbi:glycosyl hydrolase [Pseudoduganella sp. FT93W]|uniref:Glycosyl hydrolase n=1 Tax=Duganella fentianensis TaxID=2692177 RepID=A0A845I3Z4_9BURK|nr:glycoside hydrolase family 9 protein [Duganella fentianensis]MYN45608.1 glycosyl hydrolase [Duganella fentianensis]